MVTDHRKPKWFFYPAWIVLSAISIPIALGIAWAIVSLIMHSKAVGGTMQVGGHTRTTEDFLMSYILLPMLGLLTGFLQYLLLRRYLTRMGGWIAATLGGWLLPLVVIAPLAALLPAVDGDTIWYAIFTMALYGGSIGLTQWLVLRRRVRHAGWWILASVLGWGIAGLIAGNTLTSLLDALPIGLLPPIATSIAWWLLLDRLSHKPAKAYRNGAMTC